MHRFCFDELGMTIRQEDMAGARHLGACIWPSGLLMAHWLKAQPWRVMNLRVLELGTGGGLVGIYASRLGASEVLSTDVDLEICGEQRRESMHRQVRSEINCARPILYEGML